MTADAVAPAGDGPVDAPQRVSVIVRSMDRPTLHDALDSVAAQTHPDIEVIVVNARGPQHLPLPAGWGALPIRMVEAPEAAPLRRAQAANRGLDAAGGPLALFLDDDDLLLPDHLQRLVAALAAHPDAPAAFADVELGACVDGQWRREHTFDAGFDATRLLFENYLPIHGVLFRRRSAAPEAPRFDERFDVFEDWDFWLQTAEAGAFVHVPGVSARYRVSADGQSDVFTESAQTAAARRRLFEKWRSRIGADRHAALLETAQTLYRQAGRQAAQIGSLQAGEDSLRAVVAHQNVDLAEAARMHADLGRVVAEREREIADALAHVQAVQAVVAERERDIAAAGAHADGLTGQIAARERDAANASAHAAALQGVVGEREREIDDALAQLAGVQAILTERDREIGDLATAVEDQRRRLGDADPAFLQSGPGRSGSEHTAVFTIVSRNYFHYALNLMASVAEHLPGTRRVIAVCDTLDGLVSPDPGIELVPVDRLGIPELDRMAVYYSILELNTAVKPSVFRWLFDDPAIDRVIYFDPDIQLYSSGRELLDRLRTADVVLTPHLTAPLDDKRHPSDLQILQSGTYNLGFLALRRSDSSTRLLQWWARKLVRDCVVDIPNGLFTDQKWMDLLPGFYRHVHVERNPGWNVAYWNLAHRSLTRLGDDAYRVDGAPLFFFHFSGFDPRSGSVSKHQDRFTLADCGPAVERLFAHYAKALAMAGAQRHARLPYIYAELADGTPLADCGRRAVRNHALWDDTTPALRSPAGARWLVDFLTAPVDDLEPPISRLALQLYQDRADLQRAFPDMLSTRREAYRGWFAVQAGPEAGVAAPLAVMRPARRPATAPEAAQERAVADTPDASAAATAEGMPGHPAAAPRPPPASRPARPGGAVAIWPYKAAYRMAWAARGVLRPLTSLPFRARVRAALLQRAFPISASGQIGVTRLASPDAAAVGHGSPTRAPAAPPGRPTGVTVVGYLHAESGVGESARATLRALATTSVPRSVVDFRVGNVSPMGETVDGALPRGGRHAVTLFHINADQLPLARALLGEDLFQDTYRIGFWAWELETFPEQWHGAFAHVDEVWVPSTFCQRAIAAVSPVPVLVMPHAVDVPASATPDRAGFGLHADAVVFLAMADMLSADGRKNPMAAVDAFISAFGDLPPHAHTGPQLIVKIANAERNPQAHDRLRQRVAAHPRVRLVTDTFDRPKLNRLLDSVDCFVSLHRAEGFGLVIAEAMARGKVVVATGWSGNMDFMDHTNALPVQYTLQPIAEDDGPYRRGERWAEPDLHDAAAQLRAVAADGALRERLGSTARRRCAESLSAGVIGRQLQARLSLLASRGQP